MKFNVGPFSCRVIIVEQPPIFDGKPCDGLIDFDSELIQITMRLSGKRRLNVLLHEISHAWQFHFPMPCEEEGQCDFFANAAQAAMQDLLAQGGIDALNAMQPAAEEVGAA